MPAHTLGLSVGPWSVWTQIGSWITGSVDSALAIGGQILIILIGAWLLQRLAYVLIRRAERAVLANNMPKWAGLPSKWATELMDQRSIERRIQRTRTSSSVLRNVAKLAIWTIALIMVLSAVGINTGPLLASAGVVGVALGFGAQSLVKDFLTGLFMMLEDQYGVGDRVDFGDAKGTVEEVGMRVTRVRADDSTLWFIPNGQILRVANLSQGWGRAVIDVTQIRPAQRDAVIESLRQAAQRVQESRSGNDFAKHPNAIRVTSLPPTGSVARLVIQTRDHRQWGIIEQTTDEATRLLADAGLHVERVRQDDESTQPLPMAVAPNADPKAFSTNLTAPNAAAHVVLRVISDEAAHAGSGDSGTEG